MEMNNFLEFLYHDKNFCGEKYVEELCFDILTTCKDVKNWNLSKDKILNKVHYLNAFMQFYHTQSSLVVFDEALNEKVTNTFTVLLSFYQRSSCDNLAPVCQFLMLCTKLSMLSVATLQYCKEKVMQAIEVFFEQRFMGDLKFDKDTTLSNVNLTQLMENCASDGSPQLIVSIFSLLCESICALDSCNEDFRSYAALFQKYLICTLDSEHHSATAIGECLLKIQDFLCKMSLPILSYLTRSTDFDEISNKKTFALEVAAGITILQSLFSIGFVQNENHKVFITFLNQILSISSLWCLVQLGVYHKQSFVRKRTSLFLLSVIRHIEQCALRLQVSWERPGPSLCEENPACHILSLTSDNHAKVVFDLKTFVQICEILEESQSHLVKPVMAKVANLFEQMPFDSHLPFSWICPILHRMFSHESKQMQKEGLAFFLDLKQEGPFLQQANCFTFLCDGLVKMLREDFLYFQADRNVDALSKDRLEVDLKLKKFLSRCLQNSSCPQKLMKNILHGMSALTWSPVSLLHLCMALRSLPPSRAWDDEDQVSIRKLFVETIRTHDVTMKYEIQRVLMECVILHCAPSLVFIDDVMQLTLECVMGRAVRRDSVLWGELSQWLVGEVTGMRSMLHGGADVVKLNLARVHWLLSDGAPCEASGGKVVPTPQHVALCYCLVVDGLAFAHDRKQAKELVAAVASVVAAVTDKAATHVYTSQKRIDFAFEFIDSLLEISDRSLASPVPDLLHELSVPFYKKVLEGALEYVARKVPSFGAGRNGRLYLSTIGRLVKFLNTKTPPLQRRTFLSKISAPLSTMVGSALRLHSRIIKEGKLAKQEVHLVVEAPSALLWFCELMKQHNLAPDKPLMLKIREYLSCLDLDGAKLNQHKEVLKEEWCRVLVDYTDLQWACVPYSFRLGVSPFVHHDSMLDLFNEQLETASGSGLVTLFSIAPSLLERVSNDGASAACAMRMWKICTESFHSSSFRTLYKLFVPAIFQPCILSSAPESLIREALDTIFGEISFHSKLKAGLLYDVIIACKQFWFPAEASDLVTTNNLTEVKGNIVLKDHSGEGDVSLLSTLPFDAVHPQSTEPSSPPLISAGQHMDFLVHCLTYSPAPTKTARSFRQALARVDAARGSLSSMDEGSSVSLAATSLLLALKLTNPEHVTFSNDVIRRLLERDDVISKEHPRCHLFSPSHLMKQRIWQAILLLTPYIGEGQAGELIGTVVPRLSRDVQASVRHLMEWIVALLLSRFRRFEVVIATRLKRNVTKSESLSSTSSLLTIMLMCGTSRRHSLPLEEQDKFFLGLAHLALPWCTSQHFTVRLYGHSLLHSVDQHFKRGGRSGLLHSALPWLGPCLDFADSSSGNVGRHWKRIKDHFMLFHLDPVMDYSIESIYSSLPSLCLMDSPDMGEVERFLSDTWLPLHNQRDALRRLAPPAWIASPGHQRSGEAGSDTLATDDDVTKMLNLQKKIVVSEQPAKEAGERLILAASLIEKSSNLGGLTRTCEVFGAERMVVDSLSTLSDKLYLALSVTAHKWLPMVEVRRHKLGGYLSKMKGEGYTIIGAEQTEQSQCLTQYRFPKKSLVVLGNEKEGIPPSILSLLDACVEISQTGRVRSLNVHVSGAILMWEYRKQHSH